MAARIVTVFGGSGFLGRHAVQQLAQDGAQIRVACRHPNLALFLKPLGDVGQVVLIQANVRDDTSVARALEGAHEAVNLVGILVERGRQSFTEVHARAAGRIARAAAAAGVRRLVHVSAVGADSASPSAYARSKAAGEAAVREAFAGATILRPSLLFGPDDDFFNKFAALAHIAPALPVFYSGLPGLRLEGLYPMPVFKAGTTRFQPVYVGDVAKAVARALVDPAAAGQTYELGGPTIYTFSEILELILREIPLKRPLVPVHFAIARLLAVFTQFMPAPPLTPDQVKLLRIDNVVDPGALTLTDLGIAPTAAEVILPTYLFRHRRGRVDSSPIEQT
jgi:NADH dehydrogenase